MKLQNRDCGPPIAEAVASAFDVRPRHVTVVTGRTSRSKLLQIEVDEAQGRERLRALLAG